MVSRRSTGPLRTILPALAAGLVALGIAGCSSGQVTQTDSIEPAVNGNQGNVGDVALRDVLVAYPESGPYREGEDAPLTLTIVNTGGMDDELTSVSSPAAAKVDLLGKGALPARSGLQVIMPDESAEPAEPSEPEPASEPSATESAPPSGTESAEPPSESSSESSSGSPSEEPSKEPSEEPSGSGILSPSMTYSETETAPEDVGTMSIVLTGLTKDLAIGKNVPVTFVFEHAGEITIHVPIATPDEPREDTAAE
jgi:copper(I)-binding protein